MYPPRPAVAPSARLRIPPPLRTIAIVVAYLAAAIVGLASTQDTNGIAALWPSDAILLAALLLRPRIAWRLVAWCACAAFAANLWFGTSPAESLWYAFADIAAVLVGVAIGMRHGVGPCAFDRPAEVVRFCAVATASALAGATLAALPGLAASGHAGGIWLSWFMSDLLGMLVLARSR